MTIYVDVLLAVNLYINYFLIRGAAVLMRREISSRRCLIAAGAGAVLALVILLPELPFWLSAIIKAASAAVIVLIAFGKSKLPQLIINLLCFLVISFVYAGLMLALWLFFAPFGMYYRNGTAYFDIPLTAVALFTAAGYVIVRFLRYISDRRSIGAITFEVKIIAAQEVVLKGIADTGNALCDPFSGKAVIICEADKIAAIVPDGIKHYLNGSTENIDGIRLVPCRTISGETLLPVFFAQGITIGGKPVEAAVGVCSKPIGTDCIFDPKLISL
ncbi:MAG: hypothetical protein E7485_06560 [Ruminococcaceae bacterium]|nr:hypothetical protein [Oscillospiraceae bacterium]